MTIELRTLGTLALLVGGEEREGITAQPVRAVLREGSGLPAANGLTLTVCRGSSGGQSAIAYYH